MNRPFLLAALSLLAVLAGVVAMAFHAMRKNPTLVGEADRASERSEQPLLSGRGEGEPDDVLAPGDVVGPSLVLVSGTVTLRGLGVPAGPGLAQLLLRRPPFDSDSETYEGPLTPEGTFRVGAPRGWMLDAVRLLPGSMPEEPPATFLETTVDLTDDVLTADRALDLEADAGVVVSGTVRSLPDGGPVPGADVVVHRVTPARNGTVVGADGRFVIAGLSPRLILYQCWVEATAPGFVAGRIRLPTSIPAGNRFEGIDLLLGRATRLSGRVRGPSGAMLDGVRIYAWAPRRGDLGFGRRVAWLGEASLDEAGAFAIWAAEAHPDARLEVPGGCDPLAGYGGGARSQGLDLRAGDPQTTLDLAPSVRLAVSATYPDGRAVPPELMVVSWVDEGGVPHASWNRSRTARLADVVPGSRADLRVYAALAEGRGPDLFEGRTTFTAPRVSPGGSPEGASLTLSLQALTPPETPAAWLRDPEFGIAPRAAHREYRLTVVDAAGVPLGGRPIALRVDRGASAGHTSAEGRIRLSLGLGRNFLHIDVEGYEPETVLLDVFEPGEEEATVRLTPLR